jgi:hypothetical protein
MEFDVDVVRGIEARSLTNLHTSITLITRSIQVFALDDVSERGQLKKRFARHALRFIHALRLSMSSKLTQTTMPRPLRSIGTSRA